MRLMRKRLGPTIDLKDRGDNGPRHRPWELRRERRRISLVTSHGRKAKDVCS